MASSRRPLVGVDTESSEVVQETPHPLFFLSKVWAGVVNSLFERGKQRFGTSLLKFDQAASLPRGYPFPYLRRLWLSYDSINPK